MLGAATPASDLGSLPDGRVWEEVEALPRCQVLLNQSLDLRSKNKHGPDLS